jgi:predicted N-acetyltransferase YhbS
LEIKLLSQCPEHLNALALLGFNEITRHWNPDPNIEKTKQYYLQHLNSDHMPLTFVAISDGKPVGMASLREDDGLNLGAETSPWLGSLVVDPQFRQRKIAQQLMDAVKTKAKELGYKKLYLFCFDKTIPDYYTRLGWKTVGQNEYWGHPVAVMRIEL